ncbi:hypothetical protein E6O75_ATG03611 [Venturia nashicola]|uniref:Uncharacterized protein n=1 Tax=Venturia nashicola TaxID=86259 RepID=A0A4Z1PBJ6_9PEZI|nr:hypothetical protein E6O75_ATG03611 [Venturia nashicola]
MGKQDEMETEVGAAPGGDMIWVWAGDGIAGCWVVVLGGGAGWWCWVVVLGGGAGWWCWVVVLGGGAGCWVLGAGCWLAGWRGLVGCFGRDWLNRQTLVDNTTELDVVKEWKGGRMRELDGG